MKSFSLFLLACGISTAALAQQETPRTTVKKRDNGTEKITTVKANGARTVTTTGKTNVGAVLDNTKDAAGNLVKKGEHVAKRGGHKVAKGAEKGSLKASTEVKKATAEAEKKTE